MPPARLGSSLAWAPAQQPCRLSAPAANGTRECPMSQSPHPAWDQAEHRGQQDAVPISVFPSTKTKRRREAAAVRNGAACATQSIAASSKLAGFAVNLADAWWLACFAGIESDSDCIPLRIPHFVLAAHYAAIHSNHHARHPRKPNLSFSTGSTGQSADFTWRKRFLYDIQNCTH